MSKFILPLVALLFFISESLFVTLFSGELYNSEQIFVPRFIMVFLVFLTIYGSRKMGVIYGFILGLLFDAVYTEILGIYMFLFPILCYLISKAMKVLQTNLFIVLIVSVLFIALLEVAIFEVNVILHFAEMSFSEFVEVRLLPTLILNLAFTILAAFPLKLQMEKFELETRED
ncbi:rod shape-determining protein MreD [Peribacillus saganii]|uniref:Rod shape-determining protein MreD n=1 Tax=Peribacillus saganii TaxID=2303992 RepID=A0A372LTQ6_9BACI|nr:rod shape-determining protein MreD [Peribacillus saganii]RFU71583.1 rod shape-determining protein MreD [Peribacillus saganii]